MLREFLQEAEEVSAELGDEELLEKATHSVALVLMQLFHAAALAEAGPEQRQAVLQIAREINRMRRVDHERQRLQLLIEEAHKPSGPPLQPGRVNEKQLAREVAEIERAQEKEDAWLEVEAEALRAEYVTGMENRALAPERRSFIEEFFAYYQPSVEALDLEDLPRWHEPKAVMEKPAMKTTMKQAKPDARKKPAPSGTARKGQPPVAATETPAPEKGEEMGSPADRAATSPE